MTLELPPDPSTAEDYNLWRKDALIWQKLTDVAKAKQGLSLQYAYQGNRRVHEAVLNIHSELVECEEGFSYVLDVLDGIFGQIRKEEETKTYKHFENMCRHEDQTICDYISQFDDLVRKVNSYGNAFSENLLGFKLMRGANLTKTQCEIIRACTPTADYKSLVDTMKRMDEITGHYSATSNTKLNFQTSPLLGMGTCNGGHQSERGKEDVCINYINPFNKTKSAVSVHARHLHAILCGCITREGEYGHV